MTELKPCPFCGGKGELKSFNNEYWIICIQCDSSSGMKGWDQQQVTEKWNNRVDNMPTIKQVKDYCQKHLSEHGDNAYLDCDSCKLYSQDWEECNLFCPDDWDLEKISEVINEKASK